MTWLVPQLRNRLQIRLAVQTPNDDGGFDRSYETIGTVWGGLAQRSFGRMMAEYIRGVQVAENSTHEVIIRKTALTDTLFGSNTVGFGRCFSDSFAVDFDVIADLNPAKSDFFFFMEKGSTVKGRLFRVNTVEDTNERGEFLKLAVEEIEEQGTGYNA